MCVCRHKYLNHDVIAKHCVLPGCFCTNYVRLCRRNQNTKVWGQEDAGELLSKDGREVDGKEG